MKPIRVIWMLAIAFLLNAAAVLAYDGPVEKKAFSMSSYTTVGGRTLKAVRIGYETYGTLNAKGDNAIFIAHFFTGNSHAAGKYKADDKVPGYWDAIIGANKPIDTGKYFVVSADTLVNLGANDPNVITTGPSSVAPDTGKPYGMRFPIITMRDFVNTQKALADALGIRKFVAVMGASMGSLQAMEWAAAYPDMIERVIAVIPGGLEADPYLVGRLNLWMAPIINDPNWNGGDYYGRTPPNKGVAEALKQITLDARHWGWAGKGFGRKWAAEGKNPLDGWDNKYLIEDALDKAGASRAAMADANSLLYLARANQLYQIDPKAIKAKVLFMPARSDLLLYPDYSLRAAETLKKQGATVEVAEIDGDGGHLDGVFLIDKVGERIEVFLSQ